MLFHKKNTGRCLAALALCGFFALQTPAVPAMAAQETLKIENQNFYRSDGTQITGAVAKLMPSLSRAWKFSRGSRSY